jgi:hypothetical protein
VEALTDMTDFENRLRAAMQSSVAAEHPPANLLAQVRRRHRRHLARLGAIGIAVVVAAALAVSPARSALLRDVTTRPEAPAPAIMPRGQAYGCDSQTYGALQSDWRRFAVDAGPLWIINRGIGPDFNFHNPDGTLKAVPLILLLQDNVTVSVEPTSAGQPYFRFLPGFNATDEYALSDGLPSATLTACSAQAALFGEGLTEYYLGVIVAGPRCITLDVQTSASQPPHRATLQFGRCTTGN